VPGVLRLATQQNWQNRAVAHSACRAPPCGRHSTYLSSLSSPERISIEVPRATPTTRTRRSNRCISAGHPRTGFCSPPHWEFAFTPELAASACKHIARSVSTPRIGRCESQLVQWPFGSSERCANFHNADYAPWVRPSCPTFQRRCRSCENPPWEVNRGGGNVGVVRSPVSAIVLPDHLSSCWMTLIWTRPHQTTGDRAGGTDITE